MMYRARQILSVAFLTLVIASGAAVAGAPPSPPAKTGLTISAAISLKDSLDQIEQVYVAENPGVSIAINYGGSGTLQLQIEQGAPVDIFLSAAPKQMNALDTERLLLPGTRKDFLGNEVVLIVPANTASAISSFQDLSSPNAKRIALGEPDTVPAGEYAKEVLTFLGIYKAVNSKAIFAKDVRQVLTYVETGNVDAGIVYSTDALSSAKVRVVARADQNSHSPIIYSLAVIKGSKHLAAARAFADYLSGAAARTVFEKYGFTAAPR